MEQRSRGYFRHHRERVIRKKVKIFTEFWGNKDMNFPSGVYAKGKVHCSCKMCKYEKHFCIEHYKYEEKKRLMKNEINDYLEGGV